MKLPANINDPGLSITDYLENRYTKRTSKTYKRVVAAYLQNNRNASCYHHTEILQYIGILRKKDYKISTIHSILSGIKSYYSYLCYTGKRSDNPGKSIYLKDKASTAIQLQDLFSTEELEQLLTSKKGRSIELNYRNKVLISLLIYQGLRPIEMEQLELTDIHLEQGTIAIKTSTKGNGRMLPLKANQILLFKRYIEDIREKLLRGNSSNSLLIGQYGLCMKKEDISNHITSNYKIYEPRKVNVLSIRQSVIANLLKQNNDVRIVQTFAGHKTPGTTERYKQTSVVALQSAIQQYHPIR